jgi:hypothetical protein
MQNQSPKEVLDELLDALLPLAVRNPLFVGPLEVTYNKDSPSFDELLRHQAAGTIMYELKVRLYGLYEGAFVVSRADWFLPADDADMHNDFLFVLHPKAYPYIDKHNYVSRIVGGAMLFVFRDGDVHVVRPATDRVISKRIAHAEAKRLARDYYPVLGRKPMQDWIDAQPPQLNYDYAPIAERVLAHAETVLPTLPAALQCNLEEVIRIIELNNDWPELIFALALVTQAKL